MLQSSINIQTANQKVSDTVRQLFEALNEFNINHPDPDAKAVAEYFDYFTNNYILQRCASVLAERHLIVPPKKRVLIGPISFGTGPLELKEIWEHIEENVGEQSTDASTEKTK